MPTPGFPPHTLDQGLPIWLRDLAAENPHHALHVVRGLEPAEALRILGGGAFPLRPCELPAAGPDDGTSLPVAALGADPMDDVLVAGRMGEWTFVYDDAGAFVDDEDTEELSADGRTAAMSLFTINAVTRLTYAVDGETKVSDGVDEVYLERNLPGTPGELRTALEAAGTFELDHLAPGEPDYALGMRAVCALAGLVCTLDDLRRIPLLAFSRE